MIKCHLREGLLPYTHIDWSLHLQIFNAVIAPLSTADNKLMFNRSQILGSRILFFGQWAGLDSFCFNSYSKWTLTPGWIPTWTYFPAFPSPGWRCYPCFLRPSCGRKWLKGESESGSHLKQLGSFSLTVGNHGANRRGSTFLASCNSQVFIFSNQQLLLVRPVWRKYSKICVLI